jgi:anti-sigma regulatory factor (Ser/Thr protein kinase)
MLVERWVFRAIPQAAMEARRATRQLVERTGADPAALPSIALCVTEAVANVVTHAYRHEREPGEVELEATRPTGTLCVAVRDRGCGIAPREDSPGAGLGLGLISALASCVSIRPVAPRGTELVMRFDVGERGAGGS